MAYVRWPGGDINKKIIPGACPGQADMLRLLCRRCCGFKESGLFLSGVRPPVLGVKSLDFLDFKKIAIHVKSKNHLTIEGLNEIKKIVEGMNLRRAR